MDISSDQKNIEKWQKISGLSFAEIASFLVFLIITISMVLICIKERLQIEELLMAQLPVRGWYSFPESIFVISGFLFLSFLFIFMILENSKLRKMKIAFEDMAKTDVLTGLFNRRYLEDALNRVIKTISRSQSVLSLLMVDVDFFKKYNDTYGHSMGDTCLRIIADVLVESITREEDFAARFGGEEFVVVLPHTNEKGAEMVANRLLENMRKRVVPHDTSDAASIVTVSIGGTTSNVRFTHSGIDYIKRADQALYMSKENGRNMYSFLSFA